MWLKGNTDIIILQKTNGEEKHGWGCSSVTENLKSTRALGLMTSTAIFLFCFFQWEKLKWCTKFCFFPSLSHLWKIIIRLNLGDSLSSILNLLVALLARGRVPVAQSTNYLKVKRKMLPVIPSRSSKHGVLYYYRYAQVSTWMSTLLEAHWSFLKVLLLLF